MRPERPNMPPDAIRDSQDVGMNVTGTTVWYRGKSATFTPEQVAAGAGDVWIAEQREKERQPK